MIAFSFAALFILDDLDPAKKVAKELLQKSLPEQTIGNIRSQWTTGSVSTEVLQI